MDPLVIVIIAIICGWGLGFLTGRNYIREGDIQEVYPLSKNKGWAADEEEPTVNAARRVA